MGLGARNKRATSNNTARAVFIRPSRTKKGRPTHLTATSVAALIWQGVAVVGVSYALWFWTLTRYAVAQLAAFTFISPVVGVFAGWLVFGETVTAGFALAIALVIAGLALVNWPRSRRPVQGR